MSITAKLKDRDKKDELLKAQREKRDKKEKVPFNITAQEPMSLVENRKRLYELSDSLRSQKINSRVYRNNIIMPNGDAYTDEVQYVSNKDVLEVGPSDLNVLKSVQTEKKCFSRCGWKRIHCKRIYCRKCRRRPQSIFIRVL